MRLRVIEAFIGTDGTRWTRGDSFRPGELDDPDKLIKDGFLEDIDKPAGAPTPPAELAEKQYPKTKR